MGVNQNSSQELGLYPELDPMPFSSNSAKTAQLQVLRLNQETDRQF
jgi:hypothetical protein